MVVEFETNPTLLNLFKVQKQNNIITTKIGIKLWILGNIQRITMTKNHPSELTI